MMKILPIFSFKIKLNRNSAKLQRNKKVEKTEWKRRYKIIWITKQQKQQQVATVHTIELG